MAILEPSERDLTLVALWEYKTRIGAALGGDETLPAAGLEGVASILEMCDSAAVKLGGNSLAVRYGVDD